LDKVSIFDILLLGLAIIPFEALGCSLRRCGDHKARGFVSRDAALQKIPIIYRDFLFPVKLPDSSIKINIFPLILPQPTRQINQKNPLGGRG
ncbi:hypothetical protein L6274_02635, partial [Candidatus Parcubacteria bacterium]|nr:hypothetical protein [Candidatus Parcubacteria bacterium]